MTYPCPCCGYLVFCRPPGSYDICPICDWEDDPVQLRWPDFAGGANHPSLIEAQGNYARFGASDADSFTRVRPAGPSDQRDSGFSPLSDAFDFEPRGKKLAPYPEDPTTFYWWRPTFWRRR